MIYIHIDISHASYSVFLYMYNIITDDHAILAEEIEHY